MKTLNLKSGSKDKKEGVMKTTILAIGMMVLLCMPQITSKAAAQGSHFTAMAISSLAEREIREKEKLVAEANCEIKTARNTAVAGDQSEEYLKERK